MKKSAPHFHLGLGVFETLRVDKGCAFFKQEHWQQLQQAAQALSLPLSQDFRPFDEKIPLFSGRWRWVLTQQEATTFWVEEALPSWEKEVEPFSLQIAAQCLGSANWDARWKTLSYLTHLQARKEVQADEALLLNEKGEIASASMANIFWRKGEVFYTPATEVGCREGIMRSWVCHQLAQQGNEVKQGRYELESLWQADEVFLTNSLLGVQPVSCLEKVSYSSSLVTYQLRHQLQRLLP